MLFIAKKNLQSFSVAVNKNVLVLVKMDPRIEMFKSENFNFETSPCRKLHVV